jgi:S1-C subfamily serine protease
LGVTVVKVDAANDLALLKATGKFARLPCAQFAREICQRQSAFKRGQKFHGVFTPFVSPRHKATILEAVSTGYYESHPKAARPGPESLARQHYA